MENMRAKNGFSYIELLISISVFLFLVAYIITSLPTSLKGVELGKDQMMAIQIARKEMEFVRQLSWNDQVSTNPVLQNRYTTLITRYHNATVEKTFTSVFEISPLADDPANIKVVKVRIQWDQGRITTPPGYREVVIESMTYKGE